MAEGDGASSLMRLGPDVLAHVVAALCTMEIDDDDYIEPPPLSILGNLRLCSRALRDVVDAATPCIGVGGCPAGRGEPHWACVTARG